MSRRVGMGANKAIDEKAELEKENIQLKEEIKVLTEQVETLTNEKAELEKENIQLKGKNK